MPQAFRSQSRFSLSRLGFSLIAIGALGTSCTKPQPQVYIPEGRPTQAEMEDVLRKLAAAEKDTSKLKDELALAGSALDAANRGHADLEKALADRETQLRAVKSEIEALKKRDAFIFADISAVQQDGQSAVALGRYEQFTRDFPNSPLTAHANRVISEMTAESQRETQRRLETFGARQPERQLVKLFNEGLSTPQELAPYFKGKTRAQVLSLFGRPSQTFNDGAELGYADKAASPETGKRGMLIIAFKADTVSSLRLEYAGRKIVP